MSQSLNRLPKRWLKRLESASPVQQDQMLRRLYHRAKSAPVFWTQWAARQILHDLLPEAEQALQRALVLHPQDAAAWYQRGLLARNRGQLNLSVTAMMRFLQFSEQRPEALFFRQLAADCRQAGLVELALSFYVEALAQGDLAPETCLALFQLLAAQGVLETALDCLRTLVQWHPIQPDLLAMMTTLLLTQHGQFEAARQVCLDVLPHSCWPEFWRLQAALSISPIKPHAQAWEAVFHQLQFGLNALLKPVAKLPEAPDRLFCLMVLHRQVATLAYSSLDPRPVWQAFAQLCHYNLPPLPSLPERTRGSSEPFRLGLILAPASAVMVYLLLGNLLDALDPAAYQLHVFCQGRLPEYWSQAESPYRFQQTYQLQVLPENLYAAAEMVREAQLDLAFFTEPSWYFQQYALASLRVAPVQVTTWINAQTTGLKQLDYFLSSALVELPEAPLHYSEKLICWPCLPSLPPVPEFPDPPYTRSDFGLTEEGSLLLCAQNLLKFHPDFDRALATILRVSPTTQLVLVASEESWQAEALSQRFEQLMPDVMSRIWIFPPLANAEFLGLIQVSDLGLDSFYYGAGNTAYQMLAWGLPVVTWPGEYLRGRILAALCQQLGYAEGVVDSAEAYILRVLDLLTSAEQRQQIRHDLLANAAAVWQDQRVPEALQQFLASTCSALAKQSGESGPV